MQTGYQVIAKDGQEYGPLDRDTIQRWYYEGKLDQNSRVYEPGQHKFRLKEVFDLTVWNNPALIEQAAAASTANPEFKPRVMSELVGEEDRQPTPGMFAAGILLIVNGVMGMLAIALVLTGLLAGIGEPRGYIVPIIDMIVAVGLLRGNEKFRKWGLVRAVLGGGFYFLSALGATLSSNSLSASSSGVSFATIAGSLEVVFQLIFCAGIAALLWGDWPSKIRVGIGVAAVMVAWSGIITTSVVSEFVTGYNERTQLAKSTVANNSLDDTSLGISAVLPDGWVFLTKDNPIAPVADAAMIAVHNASGCYATLLVEPDILGGATPDEYLSMVLENRQKATPTMTELGRADVAFGGHDGRRLDTSWSSGGSKLRGFSTACKAGRSYYMLTGWCLDSSVAKALPAFQSLESVFVVGPRPATAPVEIGSESEDDYYELVFFIEEHKKLSDDTQRLVARGTHDGVEVGLEIGLGSTWREGSLAPGVVTYTGGATYRSLGATSDSFVQALDEIFETTLSPNRMKDEVHFSAVSLQGDPRDLGKGPVNLKLFFESGPKNRGAELFINIDLKMRRVYLSEKDPEYRAAIIKALRSN